MQEKPIQLAEGSVAPDFAMRDKHGRENKLSDLHGKSDVVVYFYPKISHLVALRKQPSLPGTIKSSRMLARRSLVFHLTTRRRMESFVKT